jgi:hypothetical protein
MAHLNPGGDPMQMKVTEEGLLIPKQWLGTTETVEVSREGDRISIIPSQSNPTRTLSEIRSILLNLKSALREQYRVTTLGIFGSYARNEQHGESDIDILIDYIQPPSLVKVVALRDWLTELLNMKVDIVTRNGLSPEIQDQVLSDIIYLWNDES